MNVKRMLGLRSYQTAWAWLHKLRRAMVRPDRERLQGIVEVDEIYVGGEEEGGTGRYKETKALVADAVEIVGDRKLGRIRLRSVQDASSSHSSSLEPFVQDVVEPDASVLSDAWSGLSGLEKLGYDHVVINQSASKHPPHVLLPGVHLVASLLKRWLLGTYQGGVSKEHLDYYLDEFTFRFNRRTSRSRGLLFYRLMEQAVQTAHTSTKALAKGTRRGPRPKPPTTTSRGRWQEANT